jgi:uncharacterized integral membrane protein
MADETGRRNGRDARDTAKIVVVILLIVVLAAFALANTDEVDVDFVVTDVTLPLIFVLIGTAIVGGLIDRLIKVRRRRR